MTLQVRAGDKGGREGGEFGPYVTSTLWQSVLLSPSLPYALPQRVPYLPALCGPLEEDATVGILVMVEDKGGGEEEGDLICFLFFIHL